MADSYKKVNNKLEVTKDAPKFYYTLEQLQTDKASKEASIITLQAEIAKIDTMIAQCDSLGIVKDEPLVP